MTQRVPCAVQIAGELSRLAAWQVLRDASLATAFSPTQLQAATLTSLQPYTQTYYLSLPLFAAFDTLVGTLILKSSLLPPFIGIGMVAAGLGCFTFFWPPLATTLRWIVLPLGGLAEVSLMLWLLVKGVDRTK